MVLYLTYKGEQLPIRVSYYAMKMFKETTGKSLTDFKSLEFSDYEKLLFYALKQGHKVTDKVFSFTMEDMEDLMDVVFMDFVQAIPKFFPTDPQPEDAKKGSKKGKN